MSVPTADYEQEVKNVLSNVKDSGKVHPDNKELIKDYKRDKVLDDMSYATLQRNLSYLFQVAKQVGDTRFEDMGEDEVKDALEWVHSRDLADSTVRTYKKVLRSFFKWLSDEDEPNTIAWITVGTGGNRKLPQDLLTKDEVESQINACKNPRDKALIALLYETGARIGELIDLTVGDIEDRKHGKKVVIDGKTGSRRIPLVESVPYLNKWLNEHPDPDKNAHLWCKIQQPGEEGLSYNYIRKDILRASMERAEVDKPSNPHHYRHSRASYLATEMTEAELCEWFGWVQGSDEVAKYVHLSGRDIDNKYNAMHGIIDEDEEDEEEKSVVECPRCDELNEPDAGFCYRCGFALDVDMAEEVERLEDQTAEGVEADDMKIAQEVVKVMQDNPDKLTKALESLK
jgi:site-specific recombinase XerD